MAKLRTNAEACAYWADGILTREPQSSLTVNSIQVRGDTVYSFGSHFPMGIIIRNAEGYCVRVLLNSDRWPGGGYANTGGDQWSCKLEAQARIEKVRRKIELQSVPLTTNGIPDMIQCRPREGDPEPPMPELEVPTYFMRYNPGPEPVKDPHGCIAGRREEYSYQADHYICSNLELYADDQIYAGTVNDPSLGSPRSLKPGTWLLRTYSNDSARTGGSIYSRTMRNGVIEWGEEDEWKHYHPERKPANTTYKRCPHCEAFATLHAIWSRKYNGGYGRRPRDRGFKLYSEMLDIYGTEQEWRDARVRDWARVKEGKRVHAEWVERNFIPVGAITWVRKHGVRFPNLDSEGYPTRKDQEGYYRSQRNAARAERRRQREREAREARERHIARLQARRKRSFEQRAAEVALQLAHINEGLKVSVSMNDSQEVTP